jgi:AcrR family transcriptional regulator
MPPDQEASLRARLVGVGVELVSAEGSASVSLREIARRAGVSHGAPRRYFPTHLDLLAAIAREGFQQLAGQITAVADDAEVTPRARVHALGRAYLEFSRANPGMFELMFRHDMLRGNRIGLRGEALALFGFLATLVDKAKSDPEGDATVISGALWANLHGVAQLARWGSLQLATGTQDVDAMLSVAIDAHLGAP